MATDLNSLKTDLTRRMDGALETLKREFAGLRTGRASPGLLEPVRVEAYGTETPLPQVGTIAVPEARMLTVQVWDRSLVNNVVKAIRDCGLGLNPAADGQLVRVPIPQLTGDRRNELAKAAHRYAEGSKVAVRGVRRDGSGALGRGRVEMSARDSGRWRDLGVRAASAAVLVPVALGALWWGGLVWTGLAAVVGVLMLSEWFAMARGLSPVVSVGLGVVWVVPGAAALVALRAAGAGFATVLFVLCVVWASDIGAYMVGRMVGGPKLAPSISPGKTRSGAVGGLVSVMLVGVVAAALGGGAYGSAMVLAALLGVAAQAGDLLESAVKRHFGVKDSGTLIPGHGGLLDRLDAVLTAAPLAWALVAWRGVELWR